MVRAVLVMISLALLAVPRIASADTVRIPATGATPAIPGNLVRPSGAGPFPAVLVLHGCDGVTSIETQTAQTLAKQGYVAMAIDTLTPLGVKNACADPGTFVTEARYAYVALAWLATQPEVIPDRLGIVGFSMGADAIFGLIDSISQRPPPAALRVAVAYYPDCSNWPTNVSVPLQILDGDADDWTPSPPCQALAQIATAAGKTVLITTYPGATHAFNSPAGPAPREYLGHTLRYDDAATKDAIAKTNSFLAQYLK
jgi:dienelactone hydrolase